MDIVTHALMGYALAAPLMAERPVSASMFAIGCVLPDVDALARVFGKRAFLRCHQTFTHSVLAIAVASGAAAVLLPAGLADRWAAAALAGGMALHVALDYSNTFGAAVLWPLLRRRYSRQWMFFIDLPATALTVAAVVAGIWWPLAAAAYGCLLACYVAGRVLLARRAQRLCLEGTSHLIPSAVLPWRYLGLIEREAEAQTFQFSALTGRAWAHSSVSILDQKWLAAVSAVPEFRIMRGLSPAYHVTDERTDGEVTEITCRDLRTRNFGGRFGELQIAVARDGSIYRRTFHV